MKDTSMFRNVRGLPLIASALLFALLVACGGDEGDNAVSAKFRYDVVDAQTTRAQLLLTGGDHVAFEAQIGEGQEWLSFSSEFPGDDAIDGPIVPVIFLYMTKNTSPDDRKAVVNVQFTNGEFYLLTLVQQGYSSTSTFNKAWAEQPQYELGDTYIYKTYFTTLVTSDYVRNYSICYDTQKRVARWVAYPLHRAYTQPSVNRTNAWAYDPNVQLPLIADAEQQYVVRSFNTGYARGHQCPSADRYSTIDTNKQTFYATNIMPQNSTFNGGIWGILENKVRENMVSDTLYVVTGTHFADNRTTTDQLGNRIGLPSNCWKVLLRTRKGSSGKRIQDCTADELMSIGFWFANDNTNAGGLSSFAHSVAQIERMTGFTFFRNLPEEVAASVKAQNTPVAWNIR